MFFQSSFASANAKSLHIGMMMRAEQMPSIMIETYSGHLFSADIAWKQELVINALTNLTSWLYFDCILVCFHSSRFIVNDLLMYLVTNGSLVVCIVCTR